MADFLILSQNIDTFYTPAYAPHPVIVTYDYVEPISETDIPMDHDPVASNLTVANEAIKITLEDTHPLVLEQAQTSSNRRSSYAHFLPPNIHAVWYAFVRLLHLFGILTRWTLTRILILAWVLAHDWEQIAEAAWFSKTSYSTSRDDIVTNPGEEEYRMVVDLEKQGLHTQVEILQKQIAAADTILKETSEAKDLEKQGLQNEIDILQKKLEAIQETSGQHAESHDVEKEALRDNIEALKKQLEDAKDKSSKSLKESNLTIGRLQEKNAQSNQLVQTNTHALALVQGRIAELEQAVKDASQDMNDTNAEHVKQNEALEAQIHEITQKSAVKDAALAKNHKALSAVQGDLGRSNQRLRDIQARKAETTKNLEATKRGYDGLKTDLAKTKAELVTAKEEADVARAQQAETVAQLTITAQELESIRAEKAEAAAPAVPQVDPAIQHAHENELSSLRKEIEDLKSANGLLRKEHNTERAELKALMLKLEEDLKATRRDTPLPPSHTNSRSIGIKTKAEPPADSTPRGHIPYYNLVNQTPSPMTPAATHVTEYGLATPPPTIPKGPRAHAGSGRGGRGRGGSGAMRGGNDR